MLSPERARELAALARARRGWDEPGSMAALRKVAHLDADEIAAAWERFLDDSRVRTPGAFPSFDGPHWTAPAKPWRPVVERVPVESLCSTCGKPEPECRRNAALNGHEYESKADYDRRCDRDRAERLGVDPDTGEILKGTLV